MGGADTHVVNCEAGCGEKPKIAPVHQAIAEVFTPGPFPWGKTTVSERLQDGAGLDRARERMELGMASRDSRRRGDRWG